jgi:hypothetical protein
MHDYRPDNTVTHSTTVNIDGGFNNQSGTASLEGTLDMEYTVQPTPLRKLHLSTHRLIRMGF